MCVAAVDAEGEVAEWLRRMGFEVRRGAHVRLVYGRDRDILRALREEDRPVLGVSPPGVEARLAVSDIRSLRLVKNCVKVRVPRLAAENAEGRIVAVNEVALFAERPAVFVRYSVYVDGAHLFTDVGDGALVATPLGSTAYAYSAGGPRISLEAPVIEVVPVNSAMRRPPVVLPQTATVILTDVRSVEPVWLIGDGAEKLRHRDPTHVYVESYASLILPLRRAPSGAAELPPSALYVKKVLMERGPLTVEEIAKATGLKPRTVRHALKRLQAAGLVEASADPTHPKRKLYYPKP
ncbi:MAG: MarR family transcriptional regulator [Pyrobaculum sp.]